MILIGVISLVASILLLLLPETMATKLPDTIEEVEDNNRADDSDISLRREGEIGDLMTEREAQLWVKTRRHRNFDFFEVLFIFIDILRISLLILTIQMCWKKFYVEHAPNNFYPVCFLFIYLKKTYFCKLSLIRKYMYMFSIYLCVRYFCKIIHVYNYWCSSAVFSKTLSMSCLFPFCKLWFDPMECKKRLLLYKQMSLFKLTSTVLLVPYVWFLKKDRIGFTKWKM